jgi:gliding motility-associated-like protein
VFYEVPVRPQPVADFTFAPLRPLAEFDEVRFTNTSSGDRLNNFYWQLDGSESCNTAKPNNMCIFKNEGTYAVALVAVNKWGCADTVVKPITVLPDVTVFVPNTFTPNADRINEIFYPVCRGIKHYKMSVFNRWGHPIHQSESSENGWDGTFGEEPCPDGVYIWKISAVAVTGEVKQLAGHVVLMR